MMRRDCRSSISGACGIITVALLWGGMPSEAATTYRLEVRRSTTVEWVDVLEFSHVVQAFAPPGSARTHGDIRIRKRIDKSSPLLLNALCVGTNIPLMRLETWATSAGRVRYHAMRARNVLVTEHLVQMENSTNDPLETVAFNYEKIEWTYMETDGRGQASFSRSTHWDLLAGTGNVIDPDSDDDGIPDSYEIQEGLSPLVDDADSDLDRDGLTNRQEFWAGTGAGDSNSVFRITGVTRPHGDGVSLEFTFSSVPGRRYQFSSYESLDDTPAPAGTVTATNEVTTVLFTLPGERAFIRASVLENGE